MAIQTQKRFFIPILLNAWTLTWRYKVAWVVGLLALLFGGAISFQLIFQGIEVLIKPSLWIASWQTWAEGVSPISLITGQWGLLVSDPQGWLAMLFAWLIILLVLLAIFIISIYAITTLVILSKTYELQGRAHLFSAIREAKKYFKSVFWTVVLFQIFSNLLIMLLSVPVVKIGIQTQDSVGVMLIGIFFILFLIAAYLLSMVALYSILNIVVEDYKMIPAIKKAWELFRKYWFVTLEMFLLQVSVAVILTLLLLLIVSLLVIPIAIIGFFLVSQQIYDVTALLPQIVFFVLVLLAIIAGSAYTAFHLYSWTLLFIHVEKVRPTSRLAQYIELTLLKR